MCLLSVIYDIGWVDMNQNQKIVIIGIALITLIAIFFPPQRTVTGMINGDPNHHRVTMCMHDPTISLCDGYTESRGVMFLFLFEKNAIKWLTPSIWMAEFVFIAALLVGLLVYFRTPEPEQEVIPPPTRSGTPPTE